MDYKREERYSPNLQQGLITILPNMYLKTKVEELPTPHNHEEDRTMWHHESSDLFSYEPATFHLNASFGKLERYLTNLKQLINLQSWKG